MFENTISNSPPNAHVYWDTLYYPPLHIIFITNINPHFLQTALPQRTPPSVTVFPRKIFIKNNIITFKGNVDEISGDCPCIKRCLIKRTVFVLNWLFQFMFLYLMTWENKKLFLSIKWNSKVYLNLNCYKEENIVIFKNDGQIFGKDN